MNPAYVTIHNTDNDGAGANAAAHAKYQKGSDARKRKVSWHYTVDDKAVYQSLPVNEVGWHAGSSAGNAQSIGIEICMHSEMDVTTGYDRAALLTALVAFQNGIAVPGNIVQHHHWSSKNCPSVLRAKAGGWANFLKAVETYHSGLRGVAATGLAPSSHDDDDADVAVAAPTAAAAGVKPMPAANPVAFAAFAGTARDLHWPLITDDPNAMLVSHMQIDGTLVGANGRRFLANRSNGARFHVGIDIYCGEGDEVVAIADGKIVNFYSFYTRPSTGEETYALFVAHDGVVCNYGEVKANSPTKFGWKVGDKVTAGQKLARVSGTNMLHFETYVPGTKANARWMQGGTRPAALLDPSRC